MSTKKDSSLTEVRTITSEEALPLLMATAINRQRPVFLWGPPGIGKSDLIKLLGERLGAAVIDMRMALLDPTDVRGIGYYNPATNTMDWASPVDLPTKEFAAKFKHVILFLDEMNSAPPAVQAAAYQLVLNRRIGQYELPENTAIIAAGNRETDKGVTYRMPAPLANRFIHFEMRVDFDSWLNWAVTHNIHSDVVGYLSEHKGDLFDFTPTQASRSFATPRSWEFVSDIMHEPLDDKQVMDVLSGAVGEGIASKFNGHRKWSGQLPKATDILDGKEKSKLKVDEISAQYTLIVNLCYELKDRYDKDGKSANKKWHGNVDNVFRYIMDNLGTELIIMGARMMVLTYKLPLVYKELSTWTEFHSRFGKYITQAAT